jgi:hypothetical protein
LLISMMSTRRPSAPATANFKIHSTPPRPKNRSKNIRRALTPSVVHQSLESISGGVIYSEVSLSGLLAAVNPVFTWARLQRRVPVGIALDYVPPGTRLVVGRTTTVAVGARYVALRVASTALSPTRF